MKTVNIKGKEYVEVKERIKFFRSEEQYKGWCMTTEIIKLEDNLCVMQAIIKDSDDRIVATGTAYETPNTNKMVNGTSYIENCETSAWGRALGNLGIGLDGGIASAEEMRKPEPKEVPIDRQIFNALNHPNVSKEKQEEYFAKLKAGVLDKNEKTLGIIRKEFKI